VFRVSVIVQRAYAYRVARLRRNCLIAKKRAEI
jgi:hypothetical protein